MPGQEVIAKVCLRKNINALFQTMADLYLGGVELLEQLGLPRYEVLLWKPKNSESGAPRRRKKHAKKPLKSGEQLWSS